MCAITPTVTTVRDTPDHHIMRMPAVTTYNYRRNELVHPFTNIKVVDHLFSFKVDVDHVDGKVILIMDNGNVYGFKIEEVMQEIDKWYTRRYISNDEHADMCTYFESFFSNDLPVSAMDQITGSTRLCTYNPVNWLMCHVNRVDLRGMIPPEWFLNKEQDSMAAFNAIVRENVNPIFHPPSPRTVMVDIGNVFDDFSVSSIEFSDDSADDVIIIENGITSLTDGHDI